jgi:hypothetical protein
MTDIPDFTETELWTLRTTLNERYGRPVEIELADTEMIAGDGSERLLRPVRRRDRRHQRLGCGVIETARKHKNKIGKVYAGRNGIIGALTEDLIDTSKESAGAIAALRHTPRGAFGSCRYKLKSLEQNRASTSA